MKATAEELGRWLAAELPSGFELGVATAAFQIEGAVHDAGRGPSGWDAFTAGPGNILNGDTADIACDHFHRVAEDVALMKDLGIDAYRFSIAWPRIVPDGAGAANPRGLDFYDHLVDALLAAGIKPMATLYHWDTPLPLEQAGGWLNRATAERFGDYASLVGGRLGDRVDKWVTINEPATVTLNGYGLGVHAPGKSLLFDALPTAHHQLLAHGFAVQALRSAGVSGGVGITNVHSPVVPADPDNLEDVAYAGLFDILHNRIFADPVLLGHYPQVPELVADMFAPLLDVPAADLAAISAPLDFYGLNYYAPTRVGAGAGGGENPDGSAPAMAQLPFHLADWPEYPSTGFGWPVAPAHFGTALAQMRDRYGSALPPVYITENGASFEDSLSPDGAVHDSRRVEYLVQHLSAALDAVKPGGRAEGLDLRGYYAWSLLDNFEWAAGYSQRFGLVHVDFDTLARTPKDSFRMFQALARERS
ncbi:glycoside hydrolase [Arthrobacter sp. ERGS1:01]|uniref:GH1 family beta-glucosidase n=1 Tax=Arthrobacter sp. ERGS1:01 TaxID=1704044 RepID=UPI0006B4F4A9|nr:GH1 family beta-glucosidase [Arthrobacter sp. ERGS1:01]ALE07029.1 glycoside hydrolase [Arthrobacter sp. ERGS1:01]